MPTPLYKTDSFTSMQWGNGNNSPANVVITTGQTWTNLFTIVGGGILNAEVNYNYMLINNETGIKPYQGLGIYQVSACLTIVGATSNDILEFQLKLENLSGSAAAGDQYSGVTQAEGFGYGVPIQMDWAFRNKVGV